MTIRDALNVLNRSVSSRDAEVLLAHALGCSREFLHTHPETVLDHDQTVMFESFLKRREDNEPVAYITGVKEFYGRPFKCDARALIPRPETEGVIDHAVALLEAQFKANLHATNKPCPLHILELGTGSGNIAITLALELTAKNVPTSILATDVSHDALILAQKNTDQLHATANKNITLDFIQADLFDHQKITQSQPYDLIVANLPYVSTTWQCNPAAQKDVIFYEPDIALFGGADGLEHYRHFFQQAPALLKENGHIVCEYGEDQTPEFRLLAQTAFPTRDIRVFTDYAGLDRVLVI